MDDFDDADVFEDGFGEHEEEDDVFHEAVASGDAEALAHAAATAAHSASNSNVCTSCRGPVETVHGEAGLGSMRVCTQCGAVVSFLFSS